jgi:hypothetical protein
MVDGRRKFDLEMMKAAVNHVFANFVVIERNFEVDFYLDFDLDIYI